MSVGVEVDARALMLDGALEYGDVRFNHMDVKALENDQRHQRAFIKAISSKKEWAEVAEAIFDLEAWADWWISGADGMSPSFGALAGAAAFHVEPGISEVGTMLEAAALLREGWRPQKRKPPKIGSRRRAEAWAFTGLPASRALRLLRRRFETPIAQLR